MNTNNGEGTIAAIATPRGEGGIGIVRLSGPAAAAIARRLFRAAGNAQLASLPSHHLRHGYIVDPDTQERIDEVMLAPMLAPRSYTREDVVEIHCHGGTLVQQRILRLLLASGARPARPGEFTQRAFLNGRLDLAQAEAVAEIIAARSEAALRSALSVLDGELSRAVAASREDVLGILVILEASVDFPDEELEILEQEELVARADAAAQRLRALLAQVERGRLLRDGVRTAIVGRPNVGKSSLLNALLLRDRAIVHETPGTTRDVIEDWLTVRGVALRLLDTAGMRSSADAVEQLGVERSRAALESAELVLLVLDGAAPLLDADRDLAGRLAGRRAILVLNKCDLPRQASDAEAQALLAGAPLARVSALRRSGLEELCDLIAAQAADGGGGEAEGALVTRERQRAALAAAAEALAQGRASLAAGLSGEFAAADLQACLGFLGEITGETCRADVLDKIFAEFCIGK
ncbi:MAG: tRNA uridine-5-carboxymethylaminomethyl(34) synthesis GTPase MnmE [Candidatus Tectomicrobia bacterium]|nr:tRNA uridine-5-carboxymethylaminomethyl(34) synthesis GTPase MnmE [Candidatus Tectomicrobia bacterium]